MRGLAAAVVHAAHSVSKINIRHFILSSSPSRGTTLLVPAAPRRDIMLVDLLEESSQAIYAKAADGLLVTSVPEIETDQGRYAESP